MDMIIKDMETEKEIKGKAFVHWKAWHEAYPGLVSQEYLDNLTLDKCEQIAFQWQSNLLVAIDDDQVIGFVGYGDSGDEDPDIGEVFALYVLSDYYGKGAGAQLLKAGLERLSDYKEVRLWVLKDNIRAIRFYQKCGFVPTGEELSSSIVQATEIRMKLER